MLLKTIPAALAVFASLANALPNAIAKRCTEHEILAALAGTYTLVNTTRSIHPFFPPPPLSPPKLFVAHSMATPSQT
jgi:hypothetical protein